MQRYPPRSGPPRPPRTCPSLVRVFVKTGAHHPDSAFSHAHLPTHDELQLFTWRDSTLREILLLARDALPSLAAPSPAAPAAASTARYSLRLVYYDPDSSSYKSSDLATIPARDLALAASDLPASSRLDRTLADAKFVPGDFLALAHLGADGPAPPAPAAAAHGANGVGVARAGAAPFGIRGAARGAGPQFAPLHQGSGGAGPRGGGGAPGGPGAGPRGGYGPRGGAGAGGPPPMDQGWGNGPRGARTSGGGGGGAGYPPPSQGRFDDRDRPPHQRRRSSRSRSPVRGPPANGRDRDRPRSRSPPPPARRRRDSDDAATRD
ncbi:SAP18 family protein [Rhodotorula paludigena]|uniref:SAP18 family protein n=1 Tax=Rhodotorula paludigena TaxID=86838 RepID=UPI00317496A8